MNFLKREIYLDDRRINLTAVEFKLLAVFLKEPGRGSAFTFTLPADETAIS